MPDAMLDNGISALRREYRPRSEEDQEAAERLGVELDELGGSYLGCLDRCAGVVILYITWHATWCLCARMHGWERRRCRLHSHFVWGFTRLLL